MKAKHFFALLICCLINFKVSAKPDWGSTGHRVVGEIATKYLKPKTKRAIKKLLGRESLALVSTFADEIKSDRRYNEFYSWHFINMPLDAKYDPAKRHPDGDLVSGIEQCINIIKSETSSDEDKAFYLRMLIHLVGDLHQPMHVGLEEDKGGNDFKVQWFYEDSNLHRVWDTEMIDTYGMTYTELADNARFISKKDIKELQKGTVIDWVNETHELTKIVYGSIKKGDNLRYSYSYNHFDTVRSQLQIAGIRLAKVLNDLF
ncbi:S1/P1 nuclease [Seonamhaeicola maritimus]|uniref:S1/P1 nuclease n=1 Tax=Seonamhaeicola maritimus TaxID=2591822 RepID=UPI0024943AC3|nr:S1/P1 nuclease [Seonamhaeicola maritimus]